MEQTAEANPNLLNRFKITNAAFLPVFSVRKAAG